MAKTSGANGYVHALLPMLLLLQIATLAQAGVDIVFYVNLGGNCQGSGYACNGISSNNCCYLNGWTAGSVKITSSTNSGCLGGHVYRNGGCSTTVWTSKSGNKCLYGGTGYYSGASWYSSCRRRSLLAEVECNEAGAGADAACTERVEPTAVAYTEDAQKGDWILEGSNVSELYSQLMNVHDGEKVNWLKSQGATYRAIASALKMETHLDD